MSKSPRYNKLRTSELRKNEAEITKPTATVNKGAKWALIISILSLLISFFGGLPGIRSWIKDINNKPKLSFRVSNMVIGEVEDGTDIKTTLLLSGTLTNSGEKPLSPEFFSGKILWENKWKDMEHKIIFRDLELLSNDQKITIPDIEANDLQKYSQKIMPMNPINGHLLFFTSIERRKIISLQEHKFKIICHDITGKEYSCIVDFYMSELNKKKTFVYPKQNMKIEPK